MIRYEKGEKFFEDYLGPNGVANAAGLTFFMGDPDDHQVYRVMGPSEDREGIQVLLGNVVKARTRKSCLRDLEAFPVE